MAIALNRYAEKCEKAALASGMIGAGSSARPLLYDISRNWRKLIDASAFKSDRLGKWSEKEEFAAELIISAVMFLRRSGCSNIEELVHDVAELHITPRG